MYPREFHVHMRSCSCTGVDRGPYAHTPGRLRLPQGRHFIMMIRDPGTGAPYTARRAPGVARGPGPTQAERHVSSRRDYAKFHCSVVPCAIVPLAFAPLFRGITRKVRYYYSSYYFLPLLLIPKCQPRQCNVRIQYQSARLPTGELHKVRFSLPVCECASPRFSPPCECAFPLL